MKRDSVELKELIDALVQFKEGGPLRQVAEGVDEHGDDYSVEQGEVEEYNKYMEIVPVGPKPTIPRGVKMHALKTWAEAFSGIADGAIVGSKLDLDRDFKTGDYMALVEVDAEAYPRDVTGRAVVVQITDITTGYGITEGYGMVSFKKLAPGFTSAPRAARIKGTVPNVLEAMQKNRDALQPVNPFPKGQ